MSLPRFKYERPASPAEACRMLDIYGERSLPIAGGTDLLVKMKARQALPEHLVSLVELEEMGRVAFNGTGASIGACCTASRIAGSEDVRAVFPALASGAGHLGSPAVRNVATLGGNIMTASPAADLVPPLMAYGARVRVQARDRETSVPIEQVFLGPGRTCLQRGEVLVDVHLDRPPEQSAAGFFKLGNRRALQISIVNGACYLELSPQSGRIHKARIVLGAVAPTPLRAFSSEKVLVGEKPGEALFEEAAMAAAGDCSPIDDVRASAEYRRDMVRVLTRRTLSRVFREIDAAVKSV